MKLAVQEKNLIVFLNSDIQVTYLDYQYPMQAAYPLLYGLDAKSLC